MTVTITTQKLSLAHCRDYLRQNSTPIGNGFWAVKNDLKVWKTTHDPSYEQTIVALRIPAGATVFAQEDTNTDYIETRKMRASAAFVEKQFRIGSTSIAREVQPYVFSWKYKEVREIPRSCSNNYDFWYETGKTVTPRFPFSLEREQCVSGIHFFVNLYDALIY